MVSKNTRKKMKGMTLEVKVKEKLSSRPGSSKRGPKE